MRIFQWVLLTAQALLLLAVCLLAVFWLPEGAVGGNVLVLLLLSLSLNAGWYLYFRRRFVAFAGDICGSAERILRNERDGLQRNRETLTSKAVMELEKMEDVVRSRLEESRQAQEKLQKTISDLYHQLKTPLSNIHLYLEMLMEPEVEKTQALKFTCIIRQQLEKLEFLMEALMMSSRLEFEMIRLNSENTPVFQTLRMAVNGIVEKAERKKLEIKVDCRPAIKLSHDCKWTAEAIENILDNAVKYTPEGGSISVAVVPGEMFVEIRIRDTGKGIPPEHYNDIFKRFYREKSVSREEGLGLGLYIARNIITLQGGYILVRSVVGEGSCFSVFLPDGKKR